MSYTPTILGSGPGAYAFLTRTRETQQALFDRSPQVARETDRARSDLTALKTSDDLMDNYAALKVVLGAFGLDEDLNNRAFIKKVLDSDPADPKSFANRLADKRYLALARTFDFAGGTGPSLPDGKSADDVTRELDGIRSANDLLGNRALLRATLSSFGLEKDVDNTFFLQSVLESDPADPESFAGRLSDPRYAELAKALDLAGKARDRDSMYGFADLFADRAGTIETFDDLAQEPDLLAASLKTFGLDGAQNDLARLATLMTSDPADPASAVNQLDDKRFLALTKAFGFAGRAAAEAAGDPFVSRLERFVGTVLSRETAVETPADFFKDVRLMLDTFDFFDLPARRDKPEFANRILTSDRESPTSLVNVYPDDRVRAFFDGLDLQPKAAERTYPPGFAEAIVEDYLTRQFEVQVGESNPELRFAMALERELGSLAETATGNDSRWFGIMASKPLRAVFESVFGLPSSFGTLDVDRQLNVLKARSERLFGTEKVGDLLQPERLDELRQRYLVRSTIGAADAQGSGSIAVTLLAGSQRGQGLFG